MPKAWKDQICPMLNRNSPESISGGEYETE